MNIFGASWRTKIGGIIGLLGSIGLAATQIQHGNWSFGSPEWLAVFAAFGAAWANLNARDNKVSSEQAGIK